MVGITIPSGSIHKDYVHFCTCFLHHIPFAIPFRIFKFSVRTWSPCKCFNCILPVAWHFSTNDNLFLFSCSRGQFRSCIGTQGHFGMIILIVVNTVHNTSRTIFFRWRTWHAGACFGSRCTICICSCQYKFMIAWLAEGVRITHLSTSGCRHHFAIQGQGQRSIFRCVAVQCLLIVERSYFGQSRHERSGKSFFHQINEDI